MKKNKLLVNILLLASFIIIPTACSDNDAEVQMPQDKQKATLTATIGVPPETRMQVTDTGTYGAENLTLKWEVDDEINVYTNAPVPQKAATFKIEDETDITEDGKSATFTYTGTGEIPTVANAYVLFGTGEGTMFDMTYSVPTGQSATDASLWGTQKLPMLATGVSIGPEEPANVTFEHKAYVLKYSFKLPAGAADPKTVTLSDENTGLSTTYPHVTSSISFALNDYEFNGAPSNFNVYIPLNAKGIALGELTVTLKDKNDAPIGTFSGSTGSAAFEAGKIYSAQIEFDDQGTGSIMQTSIFDNTVADMTDFSGVDFGGRDGSTVENAIEIGSAQQLKKLIVTTLGTNGQTQDDFAGKFIKLTTNIHVTADEWTPLGSYYGEFYGNFDGNGHIITGELNLPDDESGFFGFIDTTSDMVIKNLTIAADINASTNGYIGGIVGQLQNYAPVTIDNCHFSGTLTSGYYCGGIAGGAQTQFPVTIQNCTSRGYINTSGDNGIAGGIIGLALSYNENNPGIITNNANYARITGTIKIGGIVGYGYNCQITSNINYSLEIEGNSNVGGILGSNEGGNTISGNTSVFTPEVGEEN